MRVRIATPGEALPILAAADGYSVQPGSQRDAYFGAVFYAVEDAPGAVVFAWAEKIIGEECVIVAAASAPRAADDWTARGFVIIEEVARWNGCASVAFQTIRQGLVKRASEEFGYRIAGYIMRKG